MSPNSIEKETYIDACKRYTELTKDYRKNEITKAIKVADVYLEEEDGFHVSMPKQKIEEYVNLCCDTRWALMGYLPIKFIVNNYGELLYVLFDRTNSQSMIDVGYTENNYYKQKFKAEVN
jgi:hypothetical protein